MNSLKNFVCVSCFFLFSAVIAEEKCCDDKSVSWITEKFAPFYIHSGDLLEKGIVDRLNQIILAEMPEYNHQIRHLPVLRITKNLKKGANIVVNAYLKNPKDNAFAQHSVTSLVVPPLRLTLRKSLWEKEFNRSEKISLRAFMKKGFVLGIPERRYFGDIISAVINEERNKENVFSSQVSHYDSYANMVHLKRVDGTIGYRAEYKYHYISKKTINDDDLISVGLKENEDEYLNAYIVIPKTSWGDQFKKRVDSVLLKVRNSPEYLAAMTEWMGTSEEYKRAIKQRFSTNE